MPEESLLQHFVRYQRITLLKMGSQSNFSAHTALQCKHHNNMLLATLNDITGLTLNTACIPTHTNTHTQIVLYCPYKTNKIHAVPTHIQIQVKGTFCKINLTTAYLSCSSPTLSNTVTANI